MTQPDFKLLGQLLRNEDAPLGELRCGLPLRWDGKLVVTDGIVLVLGRDDSSYQNLKREPAKLVAIALHKGKMLGTLDLKAVRRALGLPAAGPCRHCGEEPCEKCERNPFRVRHAVKLGQERFDRAVWRNLLSGLPAEIVQVRTGSKVAGTSHCAIQFIGTTWRATVAPLRDGSEIDTTDISKLLKPLKAKR